MATMVEHVLVPLDGSERSWAAFSYALEQFPDAELVVLHVVDPIEAGFSAMATVPGYPEEWYEKEKEAAQTLFDEATEEADEHGVALRTALEHGRPTREILKYVDANDVDHVVMGSHGRAGVTRILLGSVAEAVVRRSPVPVTVVR